MGELGRSNPLGRACHIGGPSQFRDRRSHLPVWINSVLGKEQPTVSLLPFERTFLVEAQQPFLSCMG
jgi:hypothetical protein